MAAHEDCDLGLELRKELTYVTPSTPRGRMLAKITVSTFLGGEEVNSFCLVTGPVKDVEAYYRGEIGFEELGKRMIQNRTTPLNSLGLNDIPKTN